MKGAVKAALEHAFAGLQLAGCGARKRETSPPWLGAFQVYLPFDPWIHLRNDLR